MSPKLAHSGMSLWELSSSKHRTLLVFKIWCYTFCQRCKHPCLPVLSLSFTLPIWRVQCSCAFAAKLVNSAICHQGEYYWQALYSTRLKKDHQQHLPQLMVWYKSVFVLCRKQGQPVGMNDRKIQQLERQQIAAEAEDAATDQDVSSIEGIKKEERVPDLVQDECRSKVDRQSWHMLKQMRGGPKRGESKLWLLCC